ncbi:NAD(P)/FAD-dependent oxidoreductase [Longimycelium tulufanense]|uniref:NAD(P)/FAD-dependent oxidoreductase n=1 Tax=Longimycelium tulufanense TaxID=907463 RepID=UPI0016654F8F|nr:FAD-dependent oxidoreductase [Longimycelium tulufanense]
MAYPDVVVVGGGVVGAACAEALTRHGVRVRVCDRGAPAAATTGSGEGNLLVSDKEPGPELNLARASCRRWPRLLAELVDEIGPSLADAEWEPKGGLVVATDETAAAPLLALAERQRVAGVEAVVTTDVRGLEPHLAPSVAAAVHYPEDAQLQPVLATSALLAAVRRRGSEVCAGVEVLGVHRGSRVTSVRTKNGDLPCGAVVNACGPWSGRFAEIAGSSLPVEPRRGLVLVTAPLPPQTVRHKVYDADYVGTVASGSADLVTSAVVESTRSGTVLVGSSRQRVGFHESIEVRVLRALARKALALFPVLRGVPAMRAYGGFRPYTPDHLPVIGADPAVPGLWHATGHEGAGIGLAPATGQLVAELMTGAEPHVDPAPFRVDRPALQGRALECA